MKKLVSLIALMAIVLVSSSATDDNVQYLAAGDTAPELVLSSDSGDFNLKNARSYVLLTFWKSSDAQSRIDCNKYSFWFANNSHDNLRHVSVNFDSHPEIFEEIVNLDSLDKDAQFNVTGHQAAAIMRDFDLLEGFGSILIDPSGEIIAFNPSTSDLSSL